MPIEIKPIESFLVEDEASGARQEITVYVKMDVRRTNPGGSIGSQTGTAYTLADDEKASRIGIDNNRFRAGSRTFRRVPA